MVRGSGYHLPSIHYRRGFLTAGLLPVYRAGRFSLIRSTHSAASVENLEEQILRYPELSPEGREAVDAYVAEHPRWQALLRDVKALEQVFVQAPEAETRARRALRFGALLRLAFLPRWARYAASLVLALAVFYGALFAGSRLTQPEMERLASIDGDRLSIEGYGLQGMRMRGSSPAPADSASLDARYLRSLRLLRGARTTTLGLFPRYDEAALHRAERQLDAVAREAEGGSFVQLEALFFLGKARLALGDKAGATKAFRQVVLGGGRLAPEAQQILEALYEDAAYDGPPAGG